MVSIFAFIWRKTEEWLKRKITGNNRNVNQIPFLKVILHIKLHMVVDINLKSNFMKVEIT